LWPRTERPEVGTREAPLWGKFLRSRAGGIASLGGRSGFLEETREKNRRRGPAGRDRRRFCEGAATHGDVIVCGQLSSYERDEEWDTICRLRATALSIDALSAAPRERRDRFAHERGLAAGTLTLAAESWR